MNIFVLDRDPKLASQYHNDRHVVKMILESVQLLSTAHRINGYDEGYKMTHKNHPCSVWVRESQSNYHWLVDLVNELHKEWQYRFDHAHNHKSYDVMRSLSSPNFLPNIGLTPFAIATAEDCRFDDPVKSYRSYYKNHKTHLFKWTKREIPSWIIM